MSPLNKGICNYPRIVASWQVYGSVFCYHYEASKTRYLEKRGLFCSLLETVSPDIMVLVLVRVLWPHHHMARAHVRGRDQMARQEARRLEAPNIYDNPFQGHAPSSLVSLLSLTHKDPLPH